MDFVDYYINWAATYATEKSSKVIDDQGFHGAAQTNVASYRSMPVGAYKLYYVGGQNLSNSVCYTEPIGINILAKTSMSAKIGATSLFNSETPYSISSVDKTITVTDADVQNGYVTVSFEFSSLSSGGSAYYFNVQNASLVKK